MNVRPLFYPLLRFARRLYFLSQRGYSGYQEDEMARQIVSADAENMARGHGGHCDHYGLLQSLSADKPLNVLDFGGGGGRHGWKLLDAKNMDWCVVETAALVTAAEQMLETDRLSFFSSIASAVSGKNTFDVLHISSSLQYTPSPWAYLQDLLAIEADFLLLEKTIVTSKSKLVSVMQYSTLAENIPQTTRRVERNMPVRYRLNALPLKDLIGSIEDVGFEIVAQWKDPPQSHLPLFQGLSSIGMVARRNF